MRRGEKSSYYHRLRDETQTKSISRTEFNFDVHSSRAESRADFLTDACKLSARKSSLKRFKDDVFNEARNLKWMNE